MPGDDVPADDVLDRRGQRRRLVIAALVGFGAGYGAFAGTFAIVRHNNPTMSGEVLVMAFTALGAGVGAYVTYWWLDRRARRRWFRGRVPGARLARRP